MNKVVLMTGATGFVGYNLAQHLLECNYDVVNIIDNCYKRSNRNRLLKLKKYSNFKEISIEFIDDINITSNNLIHLASYGVNSAQNELENLFKGNILFTYKLIEYASRNNHKIIYFTTAYEYLNSSKKITIDSTIGPESLYAIFKYSTTEILKYYCSEKNVAYNIFKLFPTYGPNEGEHKLIPGIIKQIFDKSEINIKYPNNVCDYLYIGDLVSLMMNIIHEKNIINKEFIVSSGIGTKVIDIVNILRKLNDSRDIDSKTGNSNATKTFVGDNEDVKKSYNWKPKVNLELGLKLTLEHYKNELQIN